jgi:hypothetical protein
MRQNKNLEHRFDSIKTQSALEQFLRKWEPVSRPELRQNKALEHVFDSIKNKRALGNFDLPGVRRANNPDKISTSRAAHLCRPLSIQGQDAI